MVGAAILIVDRSNRLLLMKRSDSGCWGLPGGATEPGEVEYILGCLLAVDRPLHETYYRRPEHPDAHRRQNQQRSKRRYIPGIRL